MLTVDRHSREPLHRQLYRQLREGILGGSLAPGLRLPATRELARELGVSRNVALLAFEQLEAEGYLEARTGSGTRVAGGARFPRGLRPSGLPPRARPRAVGFRPFRTDIVDFRSGLPALERFPIGLWQRLSRQVWGALTPLDLAYGAPEGRPELREAIAGYLGSRRGVRCGPEQIVVTAGTTQAVGLVSRLVPGGGECLLEDPITADIRRIIEAGGGRVRPVPVDEQGMRTDRLPAAGSPRLVYLTPSHQFPLGVTMPIQRRVQLLEYVRRRGGYIVEDDYDSEFRFESPPLASIQGLDPRRVVYIGTFSKTLCPSLRIGYLVLPPALVNRGRQAKWFSDLHNASVDQLILARFIREGHFARCVQGLKRVHRAQRQVLVGALGEAFAQGVQILGHAAGLHLCARFPGVRFLPPLLRELERRGVRVYPVEEHAIRKGRYQDTVILGYGMLSREAIRRGVGILAGSLAGSLAGRGPVRNAASRPAAVPEGS